MTAAVMPSRPVSTDDVREIRRFYPTITNLAPLIQRGDLLGLFVDCESNGLNPETDKIIQLALAPFTFLKNGTITGVGKALTFFEDPRTPIPAEITKINGITDEMVKGQKIDDHAAVELASNAVIVIAHNAEFDRQFIELRLPFFKAVVFGCSMRDVDWHGEGYESAKLEWLAFKHAGLFYDAHRADIDCYVALHLLSTSLPSGKSAFGCVLDAARVTHARIYATDSPFEMKDVLKARGYQWSDGKDGQVKAWFRDVVCGEAFHHEVAWLASHALCAHPKSVQFTARERFSNRIGERKG